MRSSFRSLHEPVIDDTFVLGFPASAVKEFLYVRTVYRHGLFEEAIRGLLWILLEENSSEKIAKSMLFKLIYDDVAILFGGAGEQDYVLLTIYCYTEKCDGTYINLFSEQAPVVVLPSERHLRGQHVVSELSGEETSFADTVESGGAVWPYDLAGAERFLFS